MKLSEEAKEYAEALMGKDMLEIATWAEQDKNRVRAARTQYDPKFSLMTEHHVESTRRSAKSIINAFVEAYEQDGSLIDHEDKDEIIEIIRSMIDRRLHHITNSVTERDFRHPHTGEKIPNMDSYLAGRFERLCAD